MKGPSCQFSDNSNVSLSSLEMLTTLYSHKKESGIGTMSLRGVCRKNSVQLTSLSSYLMERSWHKEALHHHSTTSLTLVRRCELSQRKRLMNSAPSFMLLHARYLHKERRRLLRAQLFYDTNDSLFAASF